MEKRNKIPVIIIVLLALFFITLFFIRWNLVEERVIGSSFIFGERVGFDLNSSALTFGMIKTGSTSTRTIEIKNNKNQEVYVSIYSKGEISDFLKVSDNDFSLSEGQNKTVSFSVTAKNDTEKKKYDGFVIIRVRRFNGFFK